MTEAVAIVPARGGSRGFPGKNLALLAGSPLLSHTVRAAQGASLIGRIVVSTDDPAIRKHALGVGAEVVDRPAELATDTAETDPVIGHALDELAVNETDLTVVLLQPTSPLRGAHHIDEAIELFHSRDCAAVVSVCSPSSSLFKAFSLGDDGFLVGHFGRNAPFSRRQDFPDLLVPNGAIYVFSATSFRIANQIPRSGLLPYLMSSSASLDIDSPEDLALAEFYLSKEK